VFADWNEICRAQETGRALGDHRNPLQPGVATQSGVNSPRLGLDSPFSMSAFAVLDPTIRGRRQALRAA